MFKKLILASVGLLLVTSANAADGAYSWQGAYVGGQIGANWAKGEYEDYKAVNATGISYMYGPNGDVISTTSTQGLAYEQGSQDFNGANFIGGIYAGYNFQIADKIILGFEGDIAWGENKTNNSSFASAIYDSGFDYYTTDYAVYSQVKSKYNGAIRARIGYELDRFLPYFAAGVAVTRLEYNEKNNENFKFNNNYWDNAAYSDSTSTSKTVVGYTLGVGTDYALLDNIILRAEYRYSDFGNNSFKERLFKNEGDYNVKYKSHDIRLGVAYKF